MVQSRSANFKIAEPLVDFSKGYKSHQDFVALMRSIIAEPSNQMRALRNDFQEQLYATKVTLQNSIQQLKSQTDVELSKQLGTIQSHQNTDLVQRIQALETSFSRTTVTTDKEVVEVKKSNIEMNRRISEIKEETFVKFKEVDEIKTQVDCMQRKIEIIDIKSPS